MYIVERILADAGIKPIELVFPNFRCSVLMFLNIRSFNSALLEDVRYIPESLKGVCTVHKALKAKRVEYAREGGRALEDILCVLECFDPVDTGHGIPSRREQLLPLLRLTSCPFQISLT